eukprot:TRINITY_DN985_c0_g1_i8.p1 TRINITY_DN985_c0_g1~~TRINITY_DN985_c0_g1_i8.p1  ORF type:complete len:194 (-),score=27.10 TRINITY_DN985_c0_g1_i8:117-698(-)
MRTAIVSLGFATAAYSKLALKEQVHKLAGVEGEGTYFGGDSMDWWKGSYSYSMNFSFGFRPTNEDDKLTTNEFESEIPIGIWFELHAYDYNELFNFATYNFYNRLDLIDVTLDVVLSGPVVPVVFDDDDASFSGYESSGQANIDSYCLDLDYTLIFLNNVFKEFYNMKTCRQSWAKLIANDFEQDAKCAYDPW